MNQTNTQQPQAATQNGGAQSSSAMARRQQSAPAQREQNTAVANADQVWSGKLSPSEQVAVRTLAREYGLDPLLNHVIILGGKLYIGVEGWLHIANNSPLYDGAEFRVLSRDEKDALLAGPDDVMFECKAYRKDRRLPGVAFGRANRNNVAAELRGEKLVIEVAQARALRKALRATFSASELKLPDLGDGERVGSDGRDYEPFWQAVKALGVSNAEAHQILGVESVKLVADLREAYRAIKAHAQAKAIESRQTPLSRNEFIVAAGNIGFPDQGAIAQAFGVGTLREAEKLGSYEELLEKLQGIAAARVTVKSAEIIPPPAEGVDDREAIAEDAEALQAMRYAEAAEAYEDDRSVGMADDDFGRNVDDEPGELLALWSDYHAQRATAKREGVKKIPDMPAGEVSAAQLQAAIDDLGKLIAAAQRQQALV